MKTLIHNNNIENFKMLQTSLNRTVPWSLHLLSMKTGLIKLTTREQRIDQPNQFSGNKNQSSFMFILSDLLNFSFINFFVMRIVYSQYVSSFNEIISQIFIRESDKPSLFAFEFSTLNSWPSKTCEFGESRFRVKSFNITYFSEDPCCKYWTNTLDTLQSIRESRKFISNSFINFSDRIFKSPNIIKYVDKDNVNRVSKFRSKSIRFFSSSFYCRSNSFRIRESIFPMSFNKINKLISREIQEFFRRKEFSDDSRRSSTCKCRERFLLNKPGEFEKEMSREVIILSCKDFNKMGSISSEPLQRGIDLRLLIRSREISAEPEIISNSKSINRIYFISRWETFFKVSNKFGIDAVANRIKMSEFRRRIYKLNNVPIVERSSFSTNNNRSKSIRSSNRNNFIYKLISTSDVIREREFSINVNTIRIYKSSGIRFRSSINADIENIRHNYESPPLFRNIGKNGEKIGKRFWVTDCKASSRQYKQSTSLFEYTTDKSISARGFNDCRNKEELQSAGKHLSKRNQECILLKVHIGQGGNAISCIPINSSIIGMIPEPLELIKEKNTGSKMYTQDEIVENRGKCERFSAAKFSKNVNFEDFITNSKSTKNSNNNLTSINTKDLYDILINPKVYQWQTDKPMLRYDYDKVEKKEKNSFYISSFSLNSLFYSYLN